MKSVPRIPSEQQLLDLKGRYIPVHQLLGMFRIRVRNEHTVLTISQALKHAGLFTVPYFATCSSATEVLVMPHQGTSETEMSDEADAAVEDLSPGSLPQHPLRIGDIPAAYAGVDSLPPSALLNQATFLMSMKNYSQLPIIEGRSNLCGVVTWKSVAMMYGTGGASDLAASMVEDAPVVERSRDFFSALPLISEHGYVLVRKNDGEFTGIVTGWDIAERFDATAKPFFVVGEIEHLLRRCLGSKIRPDAIRAVQGSSRGKITGQISDLMFGGYVKLLQGDQKNAVLRAKADENWLALGWTGVDRIQFVHRLDRVREIRNRIAHFETEPLPAQFHSELTQFAGLLRQLA